MYQPMKLLLLFELTISSRTDILTKFLRCMRREHCSAAVYSSQTDFLTKFLRCMYRVQSCPAVYGSRSFFLPCTIRELSARYTPHPANIPRTLAVYYYVRSLYAACSPSVRGRNSGPCAICMQY